MVALFPKTLRLARRSRLTTTTLRDFGGGWNTVDDDISMSPKYFPVLTNFRRNPNGTQQLRFGYSLFCKLAGVVAGNLVDTEYFNDRIIAVMTTGEIAAVDGNGTATAIWNSAIAAALVGAPAGWTNGVTSVDFVQFKQQLIIHNGTDKPITIDADFVTTYLQDLGTGSNVNVPIGKYGCVVSNFHCVAGVDADPTSVYISSQSTAGTFPGDPPPNDAITIDVGAYSPEGSSEIRGIAGFRTNLIVFFRGASLVVELGNYNEAGVHQPKFPDTLAKYGLLGHRAIVVIEQDLIFAGLSGVSSAKRSLFSGLLDSTYLSGQIEPDYRSAVENLTQSELLKNCFILYDEISHDMQLFMPGDIAFVRSAQAKLGYDSWSRYNAVSWTCGCTSFLGRVFVGSGNQIFQQGNDVFPNENYFADNMNVYSEEWAPLANFNQETVVLDPDAPATQLNRCYVCIVTHTSGAGNFAQDRAANPTYWRITSGTPIEFEMEFPWIEGREAMKSKLLRFTSMATKGVAAFTLEAYVDNLYKDVDGNVMHDAALTMDFVGNDARGFGFDEGFDSARSTEYVLREDGSYLLREDGSRIIRVADDGEGPFGGGRRSKDPRLYGFPAKFKMVKFRVTGHARRFLQIINLSFAFSRGNFRR